MLRVADFTDRREVTALGRVRTVWYGWEVAGWGGLLHEDAAVGVSGTGGIGPAALRVEGSMRNDDDGDGLAFRTAIGLDTRVTAFGRDLFIAAEYIHDDFGASSGTDIGRVLSAEPLSRGELQVLGRDEVALQLAWQAHPLAGTDLLTLWNASDGSVLLARGASFSVSNETTARIGLFLGLGREPADATTLRSEYGSAPFSVYASVSTFF